MTRQGITGILHTGIPFHHRFGEITHERKQRDQGTETATGESSIGPTQQWTGHHAQQHR